MFRVVYSRFRIGLYCLTLGLASVWMSNAFLVGSEWVDVDLPDAESSSVLPVFIKKSRFTNHSGGSGPSSPIVSLEQLRNETHSEFLFLLKNPLDKPIYLPRLKKSMGSHQPIVPYFLECQDRKGGSIYVVASTFEFDANSTKLRPQEELRLRIAPPEMARSCVIVVPYSYTVKGALELAVQNPFTSTTESAFLESTSNWVSAISEPRY